LLAFLEKPLRGVQLVLRYQVRTREWQLTIRQLVAIIVKQIY